MPPTFSSIVLKFCFSVCLVLFGWQVWLVQPSYAQGPMVDTIIDENDSECVTDCSLRDAIETATSGQTITFAPALSGQTITLDGSQLIISNSLTITGTVPITISGNNVSRIFSTEPGSVVTLSHLTLINGFDDGDGGAILNQGQLTIAHSTLKNNRSNSGAGVDVGPQLLIVTHSTLSNNRADSQGGAIYNSNGTLVVKNSTLANNLAVGGDGGAIFSGGVVTLTHSTLSGNGAPATNGGGVQNQGIFHLNNSIIANSTGGGDCNQFEATTLININSLIEDGSCNTTLSGDPKLGMLSDNGGSTFTLPLLLGSPAINAGGQSHCTTTDQRGVNRLLDNGCDIGAYESQFPTVYLPVVIKAIGS